jgi:hypothetical protein
MPEVPVAGLVVVFSVPELLSVAGSALATDVEVVDSVVSPSARLSSKEVASSPVLSSSETLPEVED